MSPSFLLETSHRQPYQLQLEVTGLQSTSSPRRAASPEPSPQYGYASAPGPQQEGNDDVVFLLSIPYRCRLHPRGPQTAGPSSSGGTSTNPIVLADDEDTSSTAEARAADDVVVISDDEDENHVPPPAPTTTDNGNARARARPTTVAGNTASSSIVIEDSGDEAPTTSIPRVVTSGSDPHPQQTTQRLAPVISES
ncbi:hypothetical protein MRS44_005173 [Fusarium solani]|uniref:uncharacterized protein n=1 Tax=Fusarium solani TaxID=169388 RepID=UPI0032C3EC95|nr:hypothetical protein MRS44_005173 [Fusarium solani]